MLRYGSTVSAAAAAAAVRELLACSAFLLLLHHCVRHTVLPCVNNCLLCTASRPTDRRCTLLPVKLSAVDILSLVCDHSTVQVHATYTTSFLFEPPHHIPVVFIMHTSGCAASPLCDDRAFGALFALYCTLRRHRRRQRPRGVATLLTSLLP